MRDFLAKRPMFTGAVMAVVVSVIGFYSETELFIIGIALGFVLIMMFIRKTAGGTVVCIAAVLAVACSCIITNSDIKSLDYADECICEGEFTVISEPQNYGEYYTVTLETGRTDTLERGIKIHAFYYSDCLSYGDIINAEISLFSVSDSEYKANNYSEKVYFTGSVINLSVSGKKEPILNIISKARSYIKNTIFTKVSYNEAVTLCAMSFGDRSYFSDEFYRSVKAAGVSHIMVVSGMHLAVIVSLGTKLSEKFFYNKYITVILILVSVIAMTAVCGFTKSIIRAGITYLLIGLSLLLDRVSTPENTLGSAVIIVLITSPFAVFSVSFQLSVLATFGILVVAIPIIDFTNGKFKFKLLGLIFSSVMISLSAFLMTLPVVIYTFGSFSTVSLITNLLISSAATFALSLTVAALIINLFIPPIADVIFFAAETVTCYINTVIKFFGSLRFSSVDVPKGTAFIALGVIIAILVFLLACKRRINMIKLKEMNKKILEEGGNNSKCLRLMRKRLEEK